MRKECCLSLTTLGASEEISIANLSQVLDSEDPKDCVPLFLRHHDPLCAPILSQNTPTTNVLIKVTVPKRTGRKRKRGSQLSYSGVLTNSVMDRATTGAQSDSVRSQGRRDDANELMSMLRDNVDKYTVEAVANIQSTHRYRGALLISYILFAVQFAYKPQHMQTFYRLRTTTDSRRNTMTLSRVLMVS